MEPVVALSSPKLEEVRQIVAERGVEFVFAQFVDLYGRPSAKLVPAAHLDGLVADGAGFAGFAAGEIGQLPSDPDIAAIPDLDSLTLVPWQPNLARFACDVTVEGEAWPYCPRTILRRQLDRAKELGYDFKLGLELEYFLLRRAEDGSIEIADANDTLEKPCYDMASRGTATSSAGATTPTITRTRTASSSRTSPTTTRS
jgi:glutamine synthetase